ncbi:MAG: hypothetical protein H6672_19855 [Anaerolineaceae bacterium]|nr:hypothetical protein [Anaerolineaceae bacterium]
MNLTPNAIHYAIEQLLVRAGCPPPERIGETRWQTAGITLDYADPAAVADAVGIIIAPCAPDAGQSLLARPPGTLETRPLTDTLPEGVALPFGERLPVLFWGEGYENHLAFVSRREDGVVVFYADLVAAAFFMLSRWEEMALPDRDMHQRFPVESSAACKQGFLDRPIVDEYADILREWLRTLRPDWTPQPGTFRVQLTHDIDVPLRWTFFGMTLRRMGGDLLNRRSPRMMLRSLRQGYRAWRKPDHDPTVTAYREIMRLSEANGFKSAFYFMAATPSRYDDGYDPRQQPYHRLIHEAIDRGHEIGFHPGYNTFRWLENFEAEKNRLIEAAGIPEMGGRQHYLRFSVPETWRIWEAAGMRYDSSMGYAAQEGFRCGTCHPFPPYDIEYDRPLNLIERPLIVMDATLQSYRRFSPDEGANRIMELARKCQSVNGEFVLLWHNTSLIDEWESWADTYRRVVQQLATMVSTADSTEDV